MITGAFARWCQLKGVPRLPAPPMTVATFVADCAPLGIEQTWRALREISAEHEGAGYADPTLGGPVSQAMNAVSKIQPPRSWAKTEWPQFFRLPYDLQLFVRYREDDRDRAVRKAQSTAGKAAERTKTDGTQSTAAAC